MGSSKAFPASASSPRQNREPDQRHLRRADYRLSRLCHDKRRIADLSVVFHEESYNHRYKLMPFALIIAGILLILVGYQGTQNAFFTQLLTDVPQFGIWFVAIMVIGALGYIPRLKDLSNAFLALVILVLFITHKGFFAQFNQAIGVTKGAA